MIIERERLEWIRDHSIVNCHCIGVDSILFDNRPGTYVRAFVAMRNHVLWKNTIPWTFSIGMHPHHCDVTLEAIHGPVYNVRIAEEETNHPFSEYKFRSAIKGSGQFIKTGRIKTFDVYNELINKIHLKAHELHSIFVPQREEAAWYVREGVEDENYQAVCWSNDMNLEKFDFNPLYQKMPMDILYRHLTYLNIKVV